MDISNSQVVVALIDSQLYKVHILGTQENWSIYQVDSSYITL